MSKAPVIVLAVVAALLAAAVIAQPAPPAKVGAVAPASAAAQLSASDRMFLADALATNQLEIDVCTYATKNASSEKVRQFAVTRVAAHKALAELFQKANDGIVATPAPTPQPGINLLGKTGADFDHAFLALLVSYDHGLAARFAAADGPQHGPAIRAMVVASLPEIRRNQAQAGALLRATPGH
ncbi:MAG: DUF4142 domain-containing protein [Proteobacteria bacterium]|nr:DUF4142 domain-containing protein [Pseudomonadota bacterium]MBS0462821.1 DUF4142 domain-containing protein [Pseudomonadota bacterium]MBS0463358.1 DUF4142 domain-containing protein [Pseudomonadota bacterium]